MWLGARNTLRGASVQEPTCVAQIARCSRARGSVLETTCAVLRCRSCAAQRKSHGAPEHVVRCSKHLARCFGAGTALPSATRTVLQSTWLGARNTLRGASVQEPLCPAQLAWCSRARSAVLEKSCAVLRSRRRPELSRPHLGIGSRRHRQEYLCHKPGTCGTDTSVCAAVAQPPLWEAREWCEQCRCRTPEKVRPLDTVLREAVLGERLRVSC
jgi:hypothetical protein